MRVFSSGVRSRALCALAGGLLVAVSALSVSPALSAAPDVPSAVASKLVDGSDLSKLWAEPGARMPVIVQFAPPELAAPASFDSPAAADAAQISAVHAVQDQILGAVFGSAALDGPAADTLAIKRMDFSPMFGISVTADELASLAANPQVLRIQEDGLSELYLDQAVPLVGMANAYAAGATGQGKAVAVLDSGTRRTHEFFAGKIVSAACYGTNNGTFPSFSYCPGGATDSTAIDSANDCDPAAIEGCGHGTHVSGIAAGNNGNRQAGEPANGVARNGSLITINVFSRFTNPNNCNTAPCILSFNTDQIKGLERVFALRNTFSIASVNMSLGGGQFFAACDGDSRKPIIDQLRAANIATVIAAGNSGFNTSVGAPACISSAITVASSTKQDVRSSFSNWGDLIDVVAPGSQILASYVSGGSNTFYDSLSGTSMASPMVAGVWAAIRTARPNATVTQIETALENTGLAISSSGISKPRIRVDQALNALGGATASIVSAVTPVARSTSVNGTVTAFATILNTGNATATSCSIAMPGGFPVVFSFSARNVTTGAPENPGVPVNIAAGQGRNFVMSFRPTATMSASIPLVFDCTNTTPAASVAGLNTFLLTGTATAPADLVSIAVTATNDGIMNVPLGGTGFASLAAVNIGANASLQARLSPNPIGVSGRTLAATLSMCQTNPNTGACITGQASILNFTSNTNQTVTFSAFVTSNGQPIAFDPATKRLFVHFFQGNSPVGSASVAVRTTANDPRLAAASAD